MKRSALPLLIILSIIGLFSCKKIKDALFPSFDVTSSTVEVSIPAVNITNVEATVGGVTVYYNLDSVIKAKTSNQFSINNVSSVKVKQLDVALEDGDQDNNLANFEYVKLNFYTNTLTTPVLITNTAIKDSTATSLIIPVTDSPELKEYLRGNQLYYTVTGKLRRGLSKGLHARVVATLHVQ